MNARSILNFLVAMCLVAISSHSAFAQENIETKSADDNRTDAFLRRHVAHTALAVGVSAGLDTAVGDLDPELDPGFIGQAYINGSYADLSFLLGELDVGWGRQGRAVEAKAGSLMRLPITLSVLAVTPMHELFKDGAKYPAPYARVGGGVALAMLGRGGNTSTEDVSTDAVLKVGGGLYLPVAEWFGWKSLRARIEATYSLQPESITGHFIAAGLGVELGIPFDRDGDGIHDRVDECPDVAEDIDGFLDQDGCPEADNDNDTLLDDNDACPNHAEDLDDFEDLDGCPDDDNDKDGVADIDDRCPLEAEDKDGFEDGDGCPDADNDKDGIPDSRDTCPHVAEDIDDYADGDGCPDLDNDGDGFPDAADKCPNQREDLNDYQDDDGCPDAANDKDGDGLTDLDDKCPREPEDLDGFEDNNGCPDPDNDADNVPDSRDTCPNDAEDVDGFEDADGCPEFDNDLDGIVDSRDKCPNESEVINGVQDDDGCPDEGAVLVRLTREKIEIQEKVFFATGSDVIIDRSHLLLTQVASLLANHGEVAVVRIEGHTDNVGDEASNERLAQKRADSVRRYLIDQGVDGARLRAVGVGELRPIASNTTSAGREMNRRVEFIVVGDDGTEDASKPEEPIEVAPPAPPSKPKDGGTADAPPPPLPRPPPTAPAPAVDQPATESADESPAGAQVPADDPDPAFAYHNLPEAMSVTTLSGQLWKTEVHASLLLRHNPAAGSVSAKLNAGTLIKIPRTITYTVKEGELLGNIAKEQLGDVRLYTLIAEASKDTLEDPSKMAPGMVLTIPLVHPKVEKKLLRK